MGERRWGEIGERGDRWPVARIERSEIRERSSRINADPGFHFVQSGLRLRSFPFAEIPSLLPEVSGPVLRQQAGTHVAMKRRIRPIAHSSDKAVFHGVEVDVIDVSFEILLVTNCVFPESTLPQRGLAISVARDWSTGIDDGRGEPTLDQMPTIRKIGVSLGQCHHDVEVIGQYDHGIDGKRVFAPCCDHR
jgi:hypothetical protein